MVTATSVFNVLRSRRSTIVRLGDQGVISNDVMHRIERDLDLEDSRAAGAAPVTPG